jgi:Mor family transcriptional regulator
MRSDLPARLVAEYAEGVSVTELARRYPHSPRVITNVLREQGATIQSYAEQRQARMVRHGLVIAAAYRQGQDVDALARRFKMAPRLVRQVLREQQVELRPGHTRTTRTPVPVIGTRRRDPKVATVDVSELIEAGVIKPGRIRASHKGRSYQARLLANGAVQLKDGSTHTLGGAAHRLTGSWSTSGYLFWRVWAHHAWLPLDTLRREYLVRLAAAEMGARLAAGEHGSPCAPCETAETGVRIRWHGKGGARYDWEVCATHRAALLGAVKLDSGRVDQITPLAAAR